MAIQRLCWQRVVTDKHTDCPVEINIFTGQKRGIRSVRTPREIKTVHESSTKILVKNPIQKSPD